MTLEELDQIAASVNDERQKSAHDINVCVAAGCLSLHSDALRLGLEKEAAGLPCRIRGTGCMGLCSAGPLVSVEPDAVLYGNVKPEDAPALVRNIGAEPLGHLLLARDQPFLEGKPKSFWRTPAESIRKKFGNTLPRMVTVR